MRVGLQRAAFHALRANPTDFLDAVVAGDDLVAKLQVL